MRDLAQQFSRVFRSHLACVRATGVISVCVGAMCLTSLAWAQEQARVDIGNRQAQAASAPEEPSELSLFEDIPMVVTASKKPELATETPAIVSIITTEDIERMGARTIMDVLRTIPGIEIYADPWNVSQITVRGLRSETSSGVKILIDGHALNDPFTGGATDFYEDLPLTNVRRIEIIRGPASSVYGANAFVSVVNILTKDADDIGGVNVALYTDTFHTVNPSFQWGKIMNELEMTLCVNYLTSRGDRLDVTVDSMSFYDAAVAGFYPAISLAPGHFREERERLDTAFKFTYHDFTLHGRFSTKTWGPFLTDIFILNDDSGETSRHGYLALDFQRFFTQRLEIQGRWYADYFALDQHERLARGLTLLSPVREGETYTYPNGIMAEALARSWRIGGEHVMNYRLFARNDLTVGIAYEYLAVGEFDVLLNTENIDRDLPPDDLYHLADLLPDVQTSSNRTVFSVFAHDKWSVRRNIDLTLGLRGDFFSDFGGVLTPKAGLTYRPDARVNLKVIFGSAFRVPAFYETFLEREAQGSAARDDLVVESLGTFEIGAGYKPFDWLFAEVNVFATEIRQLAETAESQEDDSYQITPAGSERVFGSIGGIDVEGIELELRGEHEQDIEFGILPRVINSSFRLNYSYQEARDSESRDPVPYLAKHKGNLDLGLRFSSVNASTGKSNLLWLLRSLSDEFSWHAHVFLSGERQRTAADARDALPAYALLDMTFMAHDVIKKGLDLSLSVKNLLNTAYRDPGPEFAPQEPQLLIPDDYPNSGRLFFVELRYRF